MYRIVFLAVACLLLLPCSVYASDNVTVGLTTNVIPYYYGGGGGGWGWGSHSVPYTPPDWTKMFPSMNAQSSPVPIDDRPVQTNSPTYVPPVVGNPPQYLAPTTVPVIPEGNEEQDMRILSFIGLSVIILGIILYLIIPEQRIR